MLVMMMELKGRIPKKYPMSKNAELKVIGIWNILKSKVL